MTCRRSGQLAVAGALALGFVLLLAHAAPGVAGAMPGTAGPQAASAPSASVAASGAGGRRVVLLGLRRKSRALERFARRVSDPDSPAYGRHLKPKQLRKRFAPKRGIRRRVKRILRSRRGVRSVEISSTGAVAMAVVRKGAGRRLFCARGLRPPQNGLCVPRRLRRAVHEVTAGQLYSPRGSASSASAAAAPRSGTPQGCNAGVESGAFTPNQLATAYGTTTLNARGLEGRGIRAVVLSSARVDPSAFRTWADCFSLPEPRFRQTRMPGASLDTSTDPDETYLDVEALAVAAPRLDRITAVFVPLDLAFQHSFDLFLFGALDPGRQGGRLPDLLSISDGLCESQFNRPQRRIAEHFLAAAAALGITVAAASGDLGFLGCQTPATGAGYPASSRHVTGVGGTDLALNSQNRIVNQSVWATFATDGQDGVGSGGGPSQLWRRPSWQIGPGIDESLQPGKPRRLTPDIASMASFTPGIAVFGGRGWDGGGGTSAATPLVAGLLSLVIEQERAAGRPALGSINPLLYELARTPSYNQIFSDVVTGTSSPHPDTPLGKSPAGGAAQPGYDLATGLGSLHAEALADAVAAQRSAVGADAAEVRP